MRNSNSENYNCRKYKKQMKNAQIKRNKKEMRTILTDAGG